jgi:hypothetical protein
MSDSERMISYEGGAVFVPKCPKCGRYVKADPTVMCSEDAGLKRQPNGTCSQCGRVEMPFCGFVG